MNPRKTEALRKQLLVRFELIFAPECGLTVKEICSRTGVSFDMAWEYIRRWRNAGEVESVVTPMKCGNVHKHRMVKR